MEIDRKLNIIIPVERPDGDIYVHSMPIARQVFERYFIVISKAFTNIFQDGLDVYSGPRVAAMMIRKVSEEKAIWDGPEGVQAGLMAEIRRLSSLLTLAKTGWEQTPLEVALNQKRISEDEWSEVENALSFFTVVSAVTRGKQREALLGGMGQIWGTQLSALSCMDFMLSLPTPTTTDSTGEKAAQSSIPS